MAEQKPAKADDLAALETENAALKKQARLNELRLENHKLRLQNNAAHKPALVRLELQAETKKEGGKAFYQVGGEPYYRSDTGVLHAPGSIVSIPENELPSHTWKAVRDAPAAKTALEPVAPKTGRASDKDVA